MVAAGMTAQAPQIVTVINNAAQPTYNGDPAHKCYIETCQKAGRNTCHWENLGWGKQSQGGCGKLYCMDHRRQPRDLIVNHQNRNTKYNFSECCVACIDTMEKDIHKYQKFWSKCSICFPLIMIVVFALIMIPILCLPDEA